jgi:hypothetical protein
MLITFILNIIPARAKRFSTARIHPHELSDIKFKRNKKDLRTYLREDVKC